MSLFLICISSEISFGSNAEEKKEEEEKEGEKREETARNETTRSTEGGGVFDDRSRGRGSEAGGREIQERSSRGDLRSTRTVVPFHQEKKRTRL